MIAKADKKYIVTGQNEICKSILTSLRTDIENYHRQISDINKKLLENPNDEALLVKFKNYWKVIKLLLQMYEKKFKFICETKAPNLLMKMQKESIDYLFANPEEGVEDSLKMKLKMLKKDKPFFSQEGVSIPFLKQV